MTQIEKTTKIDDVKNDAKELQLRYAYLKLQQEGIEEELKAIKVLMQAGERKFAQLQEAAVEADSE